MENKKTLKEQYNILNEVMHNGEKVEFKIYHVVPDEIVDCTFGNITLKLKGEFRTILEKISRNYNNLGIPYKRSLEYNYMISYNFDVNDKDLMYTFVNMLREDNIKIAYYVIPEQIEKHKKEGKYIKYLLIKNMDYSATDDYIIYHPDKNNVWLEEINE